MSYPVSPLPFPPFVAGTVWLVGAGPGDPALLTLLACHALTEADVIVYDALVSDGVLALANPKAKLHFAGKRGGKPSMAQPNITALLIDYARAGLKVVRLKGGDPFVFGRGGEEALDLVAAGITWHVVPGLTSGLAGLAVAGIPATMRTTNQGIILVTGHSEAGSEGAPDWAILAKTQMPLVLYMAVARLPSIAEALLQGGMAGQTPVAFIAHASLPQQRVLITHLERACDEAKAQGFGAPALIVIGAIALLRDQLSPLASLIAAP